MAQTSQIAWDDTVLPFQLDNSDVRGRIVRLDGALEEILAQHDYPPAIEALVAEMALLTALIGQSIKLRWKLSLQVRSTGPVFLIATDYYGPNEDGDPGKIRAYANYDKTAFDDASPPPKIREGHFGILIDQGAGTVPYQGITPISGGTLTESAQTYFAQSEQLPTRFALRFGKSTLPGQGESWRAGGIMLQHMPKASPFATGEGGSGESGLLSADDLVDADSSENWNRVNILLDTVEDMELIGPSVPPTDLLVRLFHEEMPRVFDAQAIRFGCTCSADRVIGSLSGYPQSEIAEMVTDEGVVTADCQFCGKHYEFDPAELGSGGDHG